MRPLCACGCGQPTKRGPYAKNHGRGTCTAEGCDRTLRGRGWCHAHWQRWFRGQDVEGTPIKVSSWAGVTCSVDACDKPVTSLGLCEPHYERQRLGKELTKPFRVRTVVGMVCSIDVCDRPVRSLGWCAIHFDFWHKHKITPEERDDYLTSIGGRCDLCGDPITARTAKVDHDHGHCPGDRCCRDCIRGLLCGNCNRLEGQILVGITAGLASPSIKLATYWSDPPFQRWLRERAALALPDAA